MIHAKTTAPRDKFSFQSCNCILQIKQVLCSLCWFHLQTIEMDSVFHWNFAFLMTYLHRPRLNPFKNFMDIYKCRTLFMASKRHICPAHNELFSWECESWAVSHVGGREMGGGEKAGGLISVIKILMVYLKRKTFDFFKKGILRQRHLISLSHQKPGR